MKDPKRKLLVNLGIIIGSFGLLGYGLFWFSGRLDARTDEIIKARQFIDESKRGITAIAELQGKAVEADAYQKRMDLILPREDQLLDFPRWLEGVAKVHQVAATFNFQGGQKPAEQNVPGYIQFTVAIDGRFDSILSFLKDIETNQRQFLAGFDHFELTRSGAIGVMYRMSVNGKLFFKFVPKTS